MKKLAYWGRSYRGTARVIIIASFLIVNILGFLIGDTLGQLNKSLPFAFMMTAFLVYLAAVGFYPARVKGSFGRRKLCDMLLVSTTFCMLLYTGNHREILFSGYNSSHAAIVSRLPDSTGKGYMSISAFSKRMKDENGKLLPWKERKKLLKEQTKAIRKTDEVDRSGKVILVILASLVALGLLFLVANLACSLSCSGSDAAAILVGIGGGFLVVFLLILVIRRIYGKRKRSAGSP